MGKSLSLDIRQRVVALVDEGFSCRGAARRLRISAASAVRIVQRRRLTGSLEPALQGRPRRSKLDAVSAWLRTRLEAEPDITMLELAEDLLARHGMRSTPAMLSRHLIHRLGYTYKEIAHRDGETAPKGARRATRVAVTCHGILPPRSIRVRPNLRTDNEANEIHGRADHRHTGRA